MSTPFAGVACTFIGGDGATVRFDPLNPAAFEMEADEGLVIWGEAWGPRGGERLLVPGPARAVCCMEAGVPHLAVHVRDVRHLYIPAVQVMGIAPRHAIAAGGEHLNTLRLGRTMH